jgi:serine/threonine protein kinase
MKELVSAPPGFEILRRIGVGGMAEIFLARQMGIEGFERNVVLKRILPELAKDAEATAMFVDEAKIAASLRHSNIVQIHTLGAADGNHFLAMEYLEGKDVRDLMRKLKSEGAVLPLEHVLSIGIGVAAGLQYAHEKTNLAGRPLRIVHRDVSPENVFITFEGEVKILDFGIAHAASRLAMTRAGHLKGKTAYMSPEQSQGDPVDRRSDIFCACILLWELSTGRRLFKRANEFEEMRAVVHKDAPRPSEVIDDFPLILEEILVRGLQRRPEDRYPTAQALQLDLERFAREEGIATSGLSLAEQMKSLFPDDAPQPQQDRTVAPVHRPRPVRPVRASAPRVVGVALSALLFLGADWLGLPAEVESVAPPSPEAGISERTEPPEIAAPQVCEEQPIEKLAISVAPSPRPHFVKRHHRLRLKSHKKARVDLDALLIHGGLP